MAEPSPTFPTSLAGTSESYAESVRYHPYLWSNPQCPCGDLFSLQHLFSDCNEKDDSLSTLRDLRRKEGLSTQDFLKPHPHLGMVPIRMLLDSIVHSCLTDMF